MMQLALATLDTFKNKVFEGDALTLLRSLPSGSVDCIVTSPPYYGLRDYGHAEQIGLENSPEAYIARLVELFRLAHRALKPTGTLWLNLGDSYASGGNNNGRGSSTLNHGKGGNAYEDGVNFKSRKLQTSLPPKNLLMIPARVALALQADGWILRSEIIWHKPSAMPESVKDRCTRSHEMIYMFSKSGRYFWDYEAGATDSKEAGRVKRQGEKSLSRGQSLARGIQPSGNGKKDYMIIPETANLRDVWTIPYEPTTEAHYATYPTEIPRRCISLGCHPDGVVLDPFMGSGTTGLVAKALGRSWLGSELNSEYIKIAERRIADEAEYKRLYDRWQNKGVIEAGQDKPVALDVVQRGLFEGVA